MKKQTKTWLIILFTALFFSSLVQGKPGIFIGAAIMFGIGWLAWRAYLLLKPASNKTDAGSERIE